MAADEGWEEGKLPDEFAFTMGQSPLGTSFNENKIGIPMFQGNADFESLDIIIPHNLCIEDFEKAVKPIKDKVIENCSQIRTLEKLRDILLPKLMIGK